MLNVFQMYTCMVNGHYAQYILKQYLFTNLKLPIQIVHLYIYMLFYLVRK